MIINCTMNYLYHDVPKVLKGNTLLPQDVLKIQHPEIYEDEVKKYKGRENILTKRIPFLNCSWSEVLFLSPVHPKNIAKALKIAGKQSTKKIRFYKINPYELHPEKAIVYLYKYDPMVEEEKEDNFTSFDPRKLPHYNKVPQKTIQYYKKKMKEGRKPLLYHFIPHILYKGELLIKNAKIIEVNL